MFGKALPYFAHFHLKSFSDLMQCNLGCNMSDCVKMNNAKGRNGFPEGDEGTGRGCV